MRMAATRMCRAALACALVLLCAAGVAAQNNQNISGLHALRWFTGGGGLCQAGMSAADCSYRRLLIRHIRNSIEKCQNPLTTNTMSVSHRGAPLLYPEHTLEGAMQAVNDGAYWVECDIAVTKDFQLVCRHSQCDLASTTNILSIPALSAKCSVPGSKCCTYDLLLSEYQQLCGLSYGAKSLSRPHLNAFSWSASNATYCPAHPSSLASMGAYVIANGAALIPEQKNCDLMCQAKLAAANGITCAAGTPYNNQTCTAVVNRISDVLVAQLKNLTSNNAALSIIQTFELAQALYITNTYNSVQYNQQVVFLFEYHGQGVQTTQADYYLGYYPAGWTTINGSPSPALGSATCAWCVNGTSPGGWYDTLTAAAAGVEYSAPSTADLVRPQGALMVASDWAKWIVGNYSSMKFIAWTLERSEAQFAASATWPTYSAAGSFNVFDSVGWAYEQHSGVSSLDYEDQLLMLYALRYDVPNFAGVFSDYPASTTAFMNCVPRYEATMPVSSRQGWANPAVPYTSVTRATTPDATPLWQQVGYGNETVQLAGSHIWRMFSGGGGLCGVAAQDEYFYDYDTVPPQQVGWGANINYTAPNFQYQFTATVPNKPNLPTVTTSGPDCAYRRKLMTWIKNSLANCNNPLAPTNFSVSHRGSPMTYPEHSNEGYRAAISYGANWIECDTAVTKDWQPVCRHSQCDLHTTTNVLFNATLAAKCTVPFTPAVVNITSGAVITPANVMCCTYDFTLAEYNSLCAVQDLGSGWNAAQTVSDYFSVGAPAFRSNAFDTLAGGTGSNCAAKPATLAGMGQFVTAAGRNLIPEQKVCDVLCQAKLIAANPSMAASWGCTVGVYCQALVNAWSDTIVGVLNSLTNNNNNATSPNAPYALGAAAPGWVLQTFEINTAKYVSQRWPMAVVCFLYQYNGASWSATQADPYLGWYPATYTAGAPAWNVSYNGAVTAFGQQCGTWCSNGTTPGGWADVYAAVAAGVEVGGISIADLVVPKGALMVASQQARAVAALGMVYTPWTMERSSAAFGSVSSATWPAGAFGNANQYPTTTGGYYLNHAGVSSLDYEDMLLMLYALKYDVPNMIGVFSDYPPTTTAFGNCVPKMDPMMPVSYAETWSSPPVNLATGQSVAGVQCNTWLVNGYYGQAGYYAIVSGANSCALPLGTPAANFAGCCSVLNSLFSATAYTSSASNCLCEADFAGFMVGALGVGNGPAGSGPFGTPLNVTLNICNTQFGYTNLYWPGATNPAYDCNAQLSSGVNTPGLVIPPNPVPGSTRAPYLLAANSTSVTIRWRTATAALSVVSYGTSMSSLGTTVTGDAGASVIEHTVVLSGLTPSTLYYYAAGAASTSTGSAGLYFKTTPAPGAATSVRFWAHGDFGEQTGGVPGPTIYDKGRQQNVSSAWLAYESSTGRTADAFLMLGDNAYNTGSDPLYQYNLFSVYGGTTAGQTGLMARTASWPTIGNHDAYSWAYTPVSASGYQTAFGSVLGAMVNSGPGVPSGTMRYYSYNYGRVHVVVLDSMTLRSPTSTPGWDPTQGISSYAAPQVSLPSLASNATFVAAYNAAGQPNQMEWLAADLKAVWTANMTDFILCQYHHPSYSDGSHKSDREIEMIEMRTLYNPILEAGGVDLCLHGHSNGYERMLPTAGFFGNQSTYTAAVLAAGYIAGAGTAASPSVHLKPAGLSANAGTTYIVAGSGGQFTPSASSYKFVTSAISNATASNPGSLGIDISGNQLTLSFIAGGGGTAAAGAIIDVFQICKGCPPPPPPPAAATASPPPPALPSGSKAYVSAVVSLAGVTAASFGPTQATQFSTVMAAQLGNGVAATDITITSVTDIPGGRRFSRSLLAAGVNVAFTVATSSSAAAASVSAAVVTTTTNSAALTTALQAAGMSAVTGVALATPPTTSVSTTPPVAAAGLTPVVGPFPSAAPARASALLALLCALAAAALAV